MWTKVEEILMKMLFTFENWSEMWKKVVCFKFVWRQGPKYKLTTLYVLQRLEYVRNTYQSIRGKVWEETSEISNFLPFSARKAPNLVQEQAHERDFTEPKRNDIFVPFVFQSGLTRFSTTDSNHISIAPPISRNFPCFDMYSSTCKVYGKWYSAYKHFRVEL